MIDFDDVDIEEDNVSGQENEGIYTNQSKENPSMNANNYYTDTNTNTTQTDDGDDRELTKEDAVLIIENAFKQYDLAHPQAPIRHLVFDYEIEEFAEVLLQILNS